MEKTPQYYIVEAAALPEIFRKVAEAKRMLETGETDKVNEAAKAVGISRSAFYKYKNYVYPHSKVETEQIVTLFFSLDDIAGILSDLLILMSSAGANILTINQNIPANGVANVTVSMRTEHMEMPLDAFVARLRSVEGVNKLEILAM